MAKKQMYLLDFFLIWLTVLPFSLCKGGVMDKINGFFFHWVIPFYASKNP